MMDPIEAAADCAAYIPKCNLPEVQAEFGKDHLYYMIDEMQSGRVSGEEAHRWLGWLQACIVMGKGATLDDMKQVNLKAVEHEV